MRIGAILLSFVLADVAYGQSATPFIVTTTWLSQHARDPGLVVLQVVHDTTEFRAGHIPGARELSYGDITTARGGVGTELRDPAELAAAFERVGVSDDSHVVLYAGNGMAPMASRAFLSLDYLGHDRVSILDGGLARWRAEGRTVSMDAPAATPGHLTVRAHPVTVDAAWMTSHTRVPGFAFIDTRTDPEYLGTGERGGLPSEGHIAGARQLEWQQLFANADSGVFLDPAAIRTLYEARSERGDTLVTYCLVGYRASMTYFGARLLGLPVRLYDGSYQEWSQNGLPVVKGAQP